jgi:hypothetical protein
LINPMSIDYGTLLRYRAQILVGSPNPAVLSPQPGLRWEKIECLQIDLQTSQAVSQRELWLYIIDRNGLASRCPIGTYPAGWINSIILQKGSTFSINTNSAERTQLLTYPLYVDSLDRPCSIEVHAVNLANGDVVYATVWVRETQSR